jgi:hypothetical protein
MLRNHPLVIYPIAGFTRNPTDSVLIESKDAGETAIGYHIRKSWGKTRFSDMIL